MKNLYKYYVLFLSFSDENGNVVDTPQLISSYAFYSYEKTCKNAYQYEKFRFHIEELEKKYRKQIFAVVVPTETVIADGRITKRKSMKEAYDGMPSYAQEMTEKYYTPIMEKVRKEYEEQEF